MPLITALGDTPLALRVLAALSEPESSEQSPHRRDPFAHVQETMNRRRFLQSPRGLSWAGVSPKCARYTLPQTTGGTDARCLKPLEDQTPARVYPRFDPEDLYSDTFWRAKATSHALDPADVQGLEARAATYLSPTALEHQYFGIHPGCGWLKAMFDEGKVAIINNVYASTNRDHVHSTLILESGNLKSGPRDNQQSGWAGRLAYASDRNIVSVSNFVRPVCYGPSALNPLGHDNARVIGASDSRNMGLYEFNGGLYEFDASDSTGKQIAGYMSRALRSYYAAKSGTFSRFPTQTPPSK